MGRKHGVHGLFSWDGWFPLRHLVFGADERIDGRVMESFKRSRVGGLTFVRFKEERLYSCMRCLYDYAFSLVMCIRRTMSD